MFGGMGSVPLLFGVLSLFFLGDSFPLIWVAILLLSYWYSWYSVGKFKQCARSVFNTVSNIVLQRPADIIKRKRPFAVWFPYTTIERLLHRLEELIRMGHMVDHCEKLRRMLHGSLQSHLKMVGKISPVFSCLAHIFILFYLCLDFSWRWTQMMLFL